MFLNNEFIRGKDCGSHEIFNNLIDEYRRVLDRLITEASNINVKVSQKDGKTLLSVTDRNGSTNTVEIYDGSNINIK